MTGGPPVVVLVRWMRDNRKPGKGMTSVGFVIVAIMVVVVVIAKGGDSEGREDW